MSKKLIKITFILMIVIQFILSSTVFAENGNLVKNPGFEEVEANDAYFWMFHCYDNDPGVTENYVDSTQAYEGSNSAFIVNHYVNDSRFKQDIPVKGNTYYRLSCWVKTENVGTEMIGANISIENSTNVSRDIRGTTPEWEYIELYGKTSANQDSLTLTVGLGGYGNVNTGKAWFDNIEVAELNSLPAGKTAVSLDPNQPLSIDDNPISDGKSESSNNYLVVITVLLIVILLGFIFFMIFRDKMALSKKQTGSTKTALSSSSKKANTAEAEVKSEKIKVKFNRTDLIIMAVMTVIYLAIALYNLGDFNVPTTSWLPTIPGESFTIDLGKNATLSRIYFFEGLGKGTDPNGKFRIEYLDENRHYKHLATYIKEDKFKWKYIDVAPVNTNRLRFVVDTARAALNEICIVESGSTQPISGITIVERDINERSEGTIENLFDEHHLFAFRPSYKNSTYFDEIYHARTAFEHIHRMEPYETSHPPLGKVIMSLGILIFGMVPFGWRIMGTLFGAAMVPIMYAFGKKVFHSSFYAFCTAFLMMFDFMHFTQTRIATIDSFFTLFVIVMYYYMYDYFVNKSDDMNLKEALKPLFLSGLFFGLGVASKWIAMYGAAGLATLFFIAKGTEIYRLSKLSDKKRKNNTWATTYRSNLFITLASCIVFFIIIPGIVYFLSYIPWMMVPGHNTHFNLFIENSKSMFSYHSGLVADHPYQSAWWEWPIIRLPMAYYFGSSADLNPGMVSKIVAMGNPAIWWVGLFAFLLVAIMALSKVNKNMVMLFILSTLSFAYIALPSTQNSVAVWILIFFALAVAILVLSKFDTNAIITSAVSSAAFIGVVIGFRNYVKDESFFKSGHIQAIIWLCLTISITILFIGMYRYDRKMLVVLAAMLFQYIPWIAVPRIVFIYHYFSIVPFLILCIVYVIKKFNDRYEDGKYLTLIYLGVVIAMFIMFYPIMSGYEVPASYLDNLRWISTWQKAI